MLWDVKQNNIRSSNAIRELRDVDDELVSIRQVISQNYLSLKNALEEIKTGSNVKGTVEEDI